MYNVNGFVDKNRDVHQEVFLDLLNSSNQTLVQDLTSMVILVRSLTNQFKPVQPI